METEADPAPRIEAPRAELIEVLAFTVPGKPEQRGSKVPIVLYDKKTKLPRLNAHGKVMLFAKDDNPRSEAYMRLVKKLAFIAMDGREMINAPVVLGADFYFERPATVHFYTTKARNGELRDDAPIYHAKSPDLAKLMRCIEDAMTGVVWVDDKLVYSYLDPTRHWGEPRAEVRIYLNPADAAAWEAAGRF
jgi:Holliday junction resolvase RusA-like endonuclease